MSSVDFWPHVFPVLGAPRVRSREQDGVSPSPSELPVQSTPWLFQLGGSPRSCDPPRLLLAVPPALVQPPGGGPGLPT